MWIARDKKGYLFVYQNKPKLVDDHFEICADGIGYWGICSKDYPEVTFENSPKELVIKE